MKRLLFLVLVIIPLVGFGQRNKDIYRLESDTLEIINKEYLILFREFRNDKLTKEESGFYIPTELVTPKDWSRFRFKERKSLVYKKKLHGISKYFDKNGNARITEYENGHFIRDYYLNKNGEKISYNEFDDPRKNVKSQGGDAFIVIGTKKPKIRPAKAKKP